MSIKREIADTLISYREAKQRIKIIENEEINNLEKMDKILESMGMDYDSVATSETNAFHSDVENKGVDLVMENYDELDEDIAKEYIRKKQFCKSVKLALEGLTPAEKFIVCEKFYLGVGEYYECYEPGRRPDVEIYTQDNFPYNRTTYFEIKEKAFNRLERLLNI